MSSGETSVNVTAKQIIARFGAVGIALICVQLDYFALALALLVQLRRRSGERFVCNLNAELLR